MIFSLDIGSRLTKICGIIPGEFENDFTFPMQLLPCKSTDALNLPDLTSLLSGESSRSSNSPRKNPLLLSTEKKYSINFYIIETSKFYVNKDLFTEFLKDKHIFITGYGKNNLDFLKNDSSMINKSPELVSHHRGVIYQTGLKDFILLDVGGQDTKVILSKNGKMIDFSTNDKCAASSGRFLENMSKIIHIENIGDYRENPLKLNSTCAVFGESELIGLMSEGISREILAASVNYSLYKRIKNIINPFLKNNLPIVFAGGISRNKAINYYLKNELNTEIISLRFPIHNGCIGAIK